MLYRKIREIMDNDEAIVYPQCVLNKFDDRFYSQSISDYAELSAGFCR